MTQSLDVGLYLRIMAQKDASDLFISAGFPISIKVDGEMLPLGDKPLSAVDARSLIYGVMSPEQKNEFKANKECNFAIFRPGTGRFRVNVFQQQGCMGMVLRRIKTKIPEFEELGLPECLQKLVMEKTGLVILVGATGSGKSTSLASMIGYRNHHARGHIVTLEDPIEYVHVSDKSLLTQREIGTDTASFEVGLKNALRQAPDVILIGEIRSLEVMELAIAFAETGHLCLTTLHATNADQALDRIISFFPKDRRDQILLDLSLNLRAIVAQRLVPKKEGDGRCLAIEIMHNTPLMSETIRRGDIHALKGFIEKDEAHGMVSFDQSLFELYSKGEISYEDAMHYADSENNVRLMIKLSGDKKNLLEDKDYWDGIDFVDGTGHKPST